MSRMAKIDTGIQCPACGSARHGVINSRPREDFVQRQRRCKRCEESFYTYEFTEARVPSMERTPRTSVRKMKALAQRIQTIADEVLIDD